MAEANPESDYIEISESAEDNAEICYKDLQIKETDDSTDVNYRNTSDECHKAEEFRKSAKYKDKETYIGQCHHSIGTGLYITDEILDLPPRFRTKVISALENAAAVNNISLPGDPLKLILAESTKDLEDKQKKPDSLVTFSTSKIIVGHENKSKPPLDRRSGNRSRQASTSSNCASLKSFSGFRGSCSGSRSNNALSNKKLKEAISDTDSLCSNASIQSEKSSQNTLSPEHSKQTRVNSVDYSVVHPKYLPLNRDKSGVSNSNLQTTSNSKNYRINAVSNLNSTRPQDTDSSEYQNYLQELVKNSETPPSDVFMSCDSDTLKIYHNPDFKHSCDSQISHPNTAEKPKNILAELFKSSGIDSSYPDCSSSVSVKKNSSCQLDSKPTHSLSSKTDKLKYYFSDHQSFQPLFDLNQDCYIKPPTNTLVNNPEGITSKPFISENGAKRRNPSHSIDKNINSSIYQFTQGDQHSSNSSLRGDSPVNKTEEHKPENLLEKLFGNNVLKNFDKEKNEIPFDVIAEPKTVVKSTCNDRFRKRRQNKKQSFTPLKPESPGKSSSVHRLVLNPRNENTTPELKSHNMVKKTFDLKKDANEKVPKKRTKEITQKQSITELGCKFKKSDDFSEAAVSFPCSSRKPDVDIKRKFSESSQDFARNQGDNKFSLSKSSHGTGDYKAARNHGSTDQQYYNSKSVNNIHKTHFPKERFMDGNKLNRVSDNRNTVNCENSEQRVLSPDSDCNAKKNQGPIMKTKVDHIKKYWNEDDIDFSDSASANSDLSSKVSNNSKRSNVSFPRKSKYYQRHSRDGIERNFNNKRNHEILPKNFGGNNKSFEGDFNDKDSVISGTYSGHSFNSSPKYEYSPYHKNNISKQCKDTDDLLSEKSNARHFESERKSNNNGYKENGFFLKIAVSEEKRDLEYWVNQFKQLFSFPFDLEKCCHFSGTLILSFESKRHATEGYRILNIEKKKKGGSYGPHIISLSDIKYHIMRPCNCRQSVLQDSINEIEKNASLCLQAINEKLDEVNHSKSFSKARNPRARNTELLSAEEAIVRTFIDSKHNFLKFKQDIVGSLKTSENLKAIQQNKVKFIIECNAFKRCLPIYSKKGDILKSIRFNSVTVIVAETGSGKSTQLCEYIYRSNLYHEGLIVCTQPRKLAAISVAQFVSGQMGTAVGKTVGYDVGMEQKRSVSTKILYMTDYNLLKTCLRSADLKGVSHVIIDEAHERSLYTDLLLGKLKQLIPKRPDLRIIITSATINPAVFVEYFDMPFEAVLDVPGRSYPVEIVWWPHTVELGWNYLQACVKKALDIHRNSKDGDILVFLTSPGEVEEAMNLFRNSLTNCDEKVMLHGLHGKSDVKEQMQVFEVKSQTKRKIIFSTNVAETSLTIPGIKYVIDSGMNKELMFDAKKNKNYLAVNFINKSSAEQRKGRAGRTQSGVCYRLYDKCNFESMPDSAVPEILKSNLQKAVLKIFELGIEPSKFDFIEAPAARTISNSVDSLEYLGAVENKKLTPLGKKLVKLPLEPQLSKLVLLGIEAGIGYEIIVIAALLSESGKLFLRFEDIKEIADEKKKKFCNSGGDLCTYLEVFKQWKEVHFPKRYDWCVFNMVSSKALNAADRTVVEIIFSLRNDLSIFVDKKCSSNFKKMYEMVLFNSFSENLCVSSGHPKLGYFSPFLSECFFIHPSSALCYLGKERPEYLVYSTLMETSRNFLFDVTPISEETIQKAYEAGSFTVPLHSLKCLQIIPKVIGPFGESVLIRHVLGKSGTKVKELESRIVDFTKSKNIQIDVAVDKGLITIYVGKRFHDKISKDIHEIIGQAVAEMVNEEDVIKMSGTALYYALGAGGLISDIIMPGEYRDIVLRTSSKEKCVELEHILKSYGNLHSVDKIYGQKHFEILVTFKKVIDAINAFMDLKKRNICSVSSKPCLLKVSDATLPLYMLHVSWCRCPCIGYGVLEFNSHIDLIKASGVLTSTSFYLDDKRVLFEPSPKNDWSLLMSNLPKNAETKVIESEVKKLLRGDVHVKRSVLSRSKNIAVTDGAIADAKKKLQHLFGNFTAPAKLTVDIKYPMSTDTSWEASVYFDNAEDGEEAFRHLSGHATIDGYKLQITCILKSSVSCSLDVYNALSKTIMNVSEKKLAEGSCKKFDVKINTEQESVQVNFECSTLAELVKMKQILIHLVQGDAMDLIGISKYHFLFSERLSSTIKRISESTNTLIGVNEIRKVITIHGMESDCQKAKKELFSLALKTDLCTISRVFNLKDSDMPAGFLKRLYKTYGYGLHLLVDSFKLISAGVELGKLKLIGNQKSVREAEKALEKICEELYQSRGKTKFAGSGENCPICFDPVTYDFFRLEHCGHAMCRQCLLLQLEAKCFPFLCAKENCGKLIVLEDIKRIISYGGDKKAFCAAALQYHISSSAGKISYCPTPDCTMVYRVTDESFEFNCPECRNSICTKCKKTYHYGMTCEMFEKCQTDEDFSLKYWVEENKVSCKSCPSCNIVIEKNEGCNHMECLNCHKHFCWLCLEIFPDSHQVYDHLPYCPNNQSR